MSQVILSSDKHSQLGDQNFRNFKAKSQVDYVGDEVGELLGSFVESDAITAEESLKGRRRLESYEILSKDQARNNSLALIRKILRFHGITDEDK